MSIVKRLCYGMLVMLILMGVFHRAQAQERLSIEVDERIELLTVMQYLADWPSLHEHLFDPTYHIDYLTRIEDAFGTYRNHPAVATLRFYMGRGFSFGDPVILMMHLSPPPNMELIEPLPSYLMEELGAPTVVDRLVDSVNTFYRDTDFGAFFQANRPYYDQILANTANEIPHPQRYIDFLEDFSGIREKQFYTIVLSTVFSHNNYGFAVTHNGTTINYNVTSPGFMYGEHPNPHVRDGIPYYQLYALEFILTHEFSHPYVNPLVAQYEQELLSVECLADPITDIMKKNAYGTTWNPVEHMVRAITAVFFQQAYGEEVARQELQNQRDNWGFIYIDDIYQLYQHYLEHRETYATFADFFPVIVKHFTQKSCPDTERTDG